jgi:hypothetical protein
VIPLNSLIPWHFYTPAPPEGVHCFTSFRPSVCLSFRPSKDIFRCIFLSNYWWQESDIWSQVSYRYAILWEAFLDPSDSYFLFADLVGFYTHWTYMRGYHKWALAHSSCVVSVSSQAQTNCICLDRFIFIDLSLELFIHFELLIITV